MNLPSHHQAQEQAQENDWPTPSGTQISEGHPQSRDFKSSVAAENDRSSQAKVIFQPAPWRSFLALGVVSLGLHLLALRIPIPAIQPVSQVNQPLKVTRLALAPKRLPKKPIPKPTPLVKSAQPKAVASPSHLQNRAVSRTAIASSRPSNPTPVKSSSPKSSDIPSPLSSPLSSPSPSAVPEESQKSIPEFDLPPYPGASFDFKILALTTKDEFKMVVDHFDKSLLGTQQQKWHSKVIIDEPNRKVYQVSKGDAQRFLSVFAKGTLTAYVLADKPTNDAALEQARQAITNFGRP